MMRIKITSYVRVSIILEPMKDQSTCNIKTINQTSTLQNHNSSNSNDM